MHILLRTGISFRDIKGNEEEEKRMKADERSSGLSEKPVKIAALLSPFVTAELNVTEQECRGSRTWKRDAKQSDKKRNRKRRNAEGTVGSTTFALLLQFRSALQMIIRLTRKNLQAPREWGSLASVRRLLRRSTTDESHGRWRRKGEDRRKRKNRLVTA